MTTSGQPIRVLVVDDSYFMRKVLSELLNDSGGQVTVLDTAQNGLEAVEKTRALKPDVITLDVEMPKMDGLAALERIMEETPTPVVMLSSHTGKGTEATIKALELGAIECLAKPPGKALENVRKIQGELIEKIKVASLCRFRPRDAAAARVEAAAKAEKKKSAPEAPKVSEPDKPALFIAAVASSTGGPRALNALFSRIRRNPLTAFVIVQHISVGFTKALARRLADVCVLTVSEAEKGERLLGGHAYVAPGGQHLVLEGKPGTFQIDFNDHPPRLGVKPSADIMMDSVVKAAGKECIGIILTGMGRDGAAGLKQIKDIGGRTFAQDAESCVVYGMPKAAVDAGVVDRQLTLDKMADEINVTLATRTGKN